MSKITEVGRELLGTGREAKENFDYDQLVKKYDKHTADQLISSQLEKGNITLTEFNTYKKVRKYIHNGGLNVKKATREAEKLAASIEEVQELRA